MNFSTARDKTTNLTIIQGKTCEASLVWGGSTPVDVTGWSAALTIRADYSSASPTAEFKVANGRVIVGTSDGKFSFYMSATDCAALPAPFTGVYEIEVTDDAGKVYRAVAGAVNILPEVVK